MYLHMIVTMSVWVTGLPWNPLSSIGEAGQQGWERMLPFGMLCLNPATVKSIADFSPDSKD